MVLIQGYTVNDIFVNSVSPTPGVALLTNRSYLELLAQDGGWGNACMHASIFEITEGGTDTLSGGAGGRGGALSERNYTTLLQTRVSVNLISSKN